MSIRTDRIITAVQVATTFDSYDDFKAAFLRGHGWLSTLAAEYNEAYQSEMKADSDRMKTELEQLKKAHAESVAALDSLSGVSNAERRTQRNALNEKHRTDQNAVFSRRDQPARVRTQVLQRLARPLSPPAQEALPDYSLMDAD